MSAGFSIKPQERLFVIAAVVCGGALLALGPAPARPFALAFLLAGVYTAAAPRLRDRVSATLSQPVAAARRAGSTFRPGHVRGLMVLVGVALIAAGTLFRTHLPAPLPAAYTVFGLLAAGWAAVAGGRVWDRSAVRRATAIFALLGGGGAAIGLVALTVRFGTNAPFFDEYASTLPLALAFEGMTGPPEKTEAILASHNGHRIATTRLATLAWLGLTGEVNFYGLMLLSNGIWLAAAGVIAWTYRRADAAAGILVGTMALVLLQPQYHQLTLWAFSIQHVAVVLFAGLCFLSLQAASPIATAAAIACSALAAYSFGSGVLTGVIGLFYLVERRRHAAAVVWLLAWTVIAWVYFNGLVLDSPGGPRPSLGERVAYLFEFTGAIATLGVFTDFIGGKQADSVHFPLAVWIARITGAALFVGLGYLAARKYWTRNFTVFGLLLLTAMSALLAAALRGNVPYSEPFMSRYAINSSLLAALLIAAILDLHGTALRRWTPAITSAALVFCVASFAVTVPYARAHSADVRYLALLTAEGLHSGELPWKVQFPFYDFGLLQRTDDSGVYGTSAARYETFDSTKIDLAEGRSTPTSGSDTRVQHVGQSRAGYTLFVASSAASKDAPIAVVVTDTAGHRQAFTAKSVRDLGIHGRYFANNAPEGTTHLAYLPRETLPDGPSTFSAVALGTPAKR